VRMNETQYKIVTCSICGARNRVKHYSGERIPICGRCHTPFTVSSPFRLPGKKVQITLVIVLAGSAVLIMLFLHGRNDQKSAKLTAETTPKITPTVEPTPSFNEPPQPPPSSGVMERGFRSRAVAPLTVVTALGTGHYCVKVIHWSTNDLVTLIFIRNGEKVRTRLPFGSYKIKYATGETWYGKNHLFGPDTFYKEADERFDFIKEGNQARGYRVELFLQMNGNLHTRPISASDW